MEKMMNFLQVTHYDGTKGLIRLENVDRFHSEFPANHAYNNGTRIFLKNRDTPVLVKENIDDIEAVMRNIVIEGW